MINYMNPVPGNAVCGLFSHSAGRPSSAVASVQVCSIVSSRSIRSLTCARVSSSCFCVLVNSLRVSAIVSPHISIKPSIKLASLASVLSETPIKPVATTTAPKRNALFI